MFVDNEECTEILVCPKCYCMVTLKDKTGEEWMRQYHQDDIDFKCSNCKTEEKLQPGLLVIGSDAASDCMDMLEEIHESNI